LICRNVEPIRNFDMGSNRATKTRELRRYVPFVERRSCSRIASRLTSIAQCERDTSESSISISAPPPSRPIVTRGVESSNSIPWDKPLTTEIVMTSSCGSARLAVWEFREPSSPEPLDLSCDAGTAIVGGPGSVGSESSPTAQLHIQHTTCEGRPFANCSARKVNFAPQLGQRIRICCRLAPKIVVRNVEGMNLRTSLVVQIQ